jgi:hypothetical protein
MESKMLSALCSVLIRTFEFCWVSQTLFFVVVVVVVVEDFDVVLLRFLEHPNLIASSFHFQKFRFFQQSF